MNDGSRADAAESQAGGRMQMPFTHDTFLDVFGAYNSTMWPAVVVLWAATVAFAWRWFPEGRADRRLMFALLAVHWAWSGIAYHWFYFRAINSVAPLFAAAFVVQAGLFGWLAARTTTSGSSGRGLRRIIGAALVLYGLVYPFLGLAFGLRYPRLPLFAVPCPTTLVTAGFLVATLEVPRVAYVLPILWAVVGTSAALTLGIRADLALVIAAAVLTLDLFAPGILGRRAAA